MFHGDRFVQCSLFSADAPNRTDATGIHCAAVSANELAACCSDRFAMRLDQNPIYRKQIIPWYDSDLACFILIVLMIFTALFGTVGITVARGQPDYHPFVWVPVVTVALSAGVAVSAALRIIKRYAR